MKTGHKLNVHETFRVRPGHLLNVLCTFNLRRYLKRLLKYLFQTFPCKDYKSNYPYIVHLNMGILSKKVANLVSLRMR